MIFEDNDLEAVFEFRVASRVGHAGAGGSGDGGGERKRQYRAQERPDAAGANQIIALHRCANS